MPRQHSATRAAAPPHPPSQSRERHLAPEWSQHESSRRYSVSGEGTAPRCREYPRFRARVERRRAQKSLRSRRQTETIVTGAARRAAQCRAPCTRRVTHDHKKSPACFHAGLSIINSGGVLLSHAVPRAVPSAPKCLTSEFGMGSGMTTSTLPPKTFESSARAHQCFVTVARSSAAFDSHRVTTCIVSRAGWQRPCSQPWSQICTTFALE